MRSLLVTVIIVYSGINNTMVESVGAGEIEMRLGRPACAETNKKIFFCYNI